MKFTETHFLGTKQILKFPDHYVALTVNVSDTGVIADSDGHKIVPMGTIVGGGGVLNDQSLAVADVNLGAVAASLATSFSTKNSNVKFTAKTVGTAGNAIKIAYVDPSAVSAALSVTVASNTITINLATDAAKVITSTADDIIAAVLESEDARNLVDAVPVSTTGSGIVQAMAAAALVGGVAGAGGTAEGVLMDDVDVTYGPELGAMIIHGFIDKKKMPVAPSEADITALKQITFIG